MREPASVSLRQAMTQIAEIQSQLAHARTFRGYRPATVAMSGLFALVAGLLQPFIVPQPVDALSTYLLLWVSVAALSLAVLGVEMVARCRRERSRWTIQMHMLALELFLPCVLVGGFLTFVIYREAPDLAWMLPGLWCLLFSLGCFASYRLLPAMLVVVPVYYLLAGVVCLGQARGDAALSPWAMVLSFGVGQLISAALLHREFKSSPKESSDG